MALPRLSPTVVGTIATTQAESGPPIPKYRVHLDHGGLHKFVPGSSLTADDWKVIGGSGGTAGKWLEVRRPDLGADLTDAAVTIVVGGKAWRRLPVATLSANRVATLSTTNAAAGDWLEITRLDVGAYTYSIVNGGAGAGTLCTMPVSVRAWARLYFDGTNWLHRASGLML